MSDNQPLIVFNLALSLVYCCHGMQRLDDATTPTTTTTNNQPTIERGQEQATIAGIGRNNRQSLLYHPFSIRFLKP
jgi:hypothetical protein